MKGIDAIQQQYIYRVNPVNLFERREPNSAQKNNIFSGNSQSFNLTHPVITGNSSRAANLDLLA